MASVSDTLFPSTELSDLARALTAYSTGSYGREGLGSHRLINGNHKPLRIDEVTPYVCTISDFGGLEVACWPLEPAENSSARLPSEGK
jgi:hypothetical protein